MELRKILDGVLAARGRDFLGNDPLGCVRRYDSPADLEIAAFLGAALAYGRVAIIRNNLDDLFRRMPEGPAAFVRDFDPARDSARLQGFRHRFNSGGDVACLCFMLQRMIGEAGSLEGYFRLGDDPLQGDIGPGLSDFCRRALEIDVSAVAGVRQLPRDSTVRYFLPSPAHGSACKRLCMFLRWVCRPDDGIDLGLWEGIAPSRLVVPLDTHVARIARLLGFTRRQTPGWKMALEVTEALRQLDRDDPLRYDFALSHLGISEGCTGKEGSWCVECAVGGLCEVGERNKKE